MYTMFQQLVRGCILPINGVCVCSRALCSAFYSICILERTNRLKCSWDLVGNKNSIFSIPVLCSVVLFLEGIMFSGFIYF